MSHCSPSPATRRRCVASGRSTPLPRSGDVLVIGATARTRIFGFAGFGGTRPMPTGQKKFSHHQDAKWQVLLLRPNDRRRRRRLRFRYPEPRRDSSSFSPRLAAKPVQLSADRNGRRSFPGCHGQIIARMLNVFLFQSILSPPTATPWQRRMEDGTWTSGRVAASRRCRWWLGPGLGAEGRSCVWWAAFFSASSCGCWARRSTNT